MKFSEKFLKLCKTHSPLMMAVELGHMEIVEQLKELGASMAFKNKVSIISSSKCICNLQLQGETASVK